MELVLSASMFLFVFPLILFGQKIENPYVPQKMPDRISFTVTEDPSNSAAVTWRTNTEINEAYAEIVLADINPLAIQKAQKFHAKTQTINTKGGGDKGITWDGVNANYHSVVFEDLEPNTIYSYRVGSGKYWSEWFQFRTTSDTNEPFTFLYFGDAQSDIKSMWSKVIRQAYSHVPDAPLMLHAGDLINHSTNDMQWGEWFEAGGFIHATIRNMPSPGNHDYGREDEVEELSPYWRPQFKMPDNGPDGLEGTCYYTDVQGVRFISLDSYPLTDLELYVPGYPEEKLEEHVQKQKVWLENILKNNPNKWTILLFHHPIYSVKNSRDNPRLRNNFKPLIDKYKVDMVLQGHDHSYARGMKDVPMENDEESGTMYVVSVSGPKLAGSGQEMQPWMDKLAIYIQLYHLISVDGDKLKFRSYNPMGELFDGFDLIKRPGKVNKIIELELSEK